MADLKLPFFSKKEPEKDSESNHFFYSTDESATSDFLSLPSGLGVTPRQFAFHVLLFVATAITTIPTIWIFFIFSSCGSLIETMQI